VRLVYYVLCVVLVDTVFFSAGFYRLPDVNRDIGRNYNITFQNVNFNESSSELTLQRRLSIKDDQNWWNCKYIFYDIIW